MVGRALAVPAQARRVLAGRSGLLDMTFIVNLPAPDTNLP
jgi:hypothetical protein